MLRMHAVKLVFIAANGSSPRNSTSAGANQ